MKNRFIFVLSILSLQGSSLRAQSLHEYSDSVVLSTGEASVVLHTATGKVDYHFAGGIAMYNTVAYLQDMYAGGFSTASLGQHPYSTDAVQDSLGTGIRINIKHLDDQHPLYLLQHITLYADKPWILVDLVAGRVKGTEPLETRYISPVAVLKDQGGRLSVPGSE